MTLTYAGIPIGAEDLAADTISGFLPSARQQNQVSTPLRADYAILFSRGNRSFTVPFLLAFGAEADSGDMLAKVLLFLGTLPASGALIVSENDRILSFPSAVFDSFTPIDRTGLSATARLTFLATGPVVEISNPLITYLSSEGGIALLSEDGNFLPT